MKKYFLSFVLIFPFLSPAHAQNTRSVLQDTIKIREVVITGTKISVNRNNVPLTVSVVSNEKIESSSESALLPVLAAQVPGLFVTERGVTGFGVAGGAAGQIMLRGVGGSPNTQVLVMVDGNPQYMGIMGHPLPDAYIASDVDRVEVLRGPGSTLYGTNAMGGVINIITKEQKEDGISANGRLMYASYNTQKYMANAGFKKDRFNAFLSFNRDRTDGHRENSDFRINNGYVKAGYDISDNFKLKTDMSLAAFKATDPGLEGMPVGFSYDILRGMGAVLLDNNFENTSGSLRFFLNFGEHDITDGFHSLDKNYGVVAYQSFSPFKDNTLTLGVDFKRYGGMAENLLANGGAGILLGDTTVNETAVYAHMQQNLFDVLTLNGGFRLEHSSVFGFEPVPTVGLAYRPGINTTIKASVAKGFRSPTIREFFLNMPSPNPDLRPERMMNYEAGVSQDLLDDRLTVELTIYQASGDNMIVIEMTEHGPKHLNSGEFRNRGIEVAAAYMPVRDLALNATYSFNSMKVPVLAAPEQQLNLGAAYKWKGFSFNLDLQHIGGLYTRLKPEIVKENYTLLNSRVAYRFGKHFDVFIKGENLTNRKYYINYGYPMPGIVVFGGVNLHL